MYSAYVVNVCWLALGSPLAGTCGRALKISCVEVSIQPGSENSLRCLFLYLPAPNFASEFSLTT